MKIWITIAAMITILLFTGCLEVSAQLRLDVETGVVFSGYNDVQIPNNSGTKISLSDELETDPAFFWRVRLIYSLAKRHNIAFLVAPLRLEGRGIINRQVDFEGEQFPQGVLLKSKYRFDSYRITYRYDVYRSKKLQTGLGFSAKIRDASISLKGGNKEAEKKNTGFVPLVNFRVEWVLAKKFTLILDGDALAGPQGRAEDIILAVAYDLHENLKVKLGYRMLEGGADVDEVYNFALLNYMVIGATLSF